MLGVKFGNTHSLKDMGLYLLEKEIGSPQPKTNKVSLVGADGDIDLSRAISEKMFYTNRKLTFKFGVINPKRNWSNIYSNVLAKLHGKNMQVILDDDLAYYYQCFVTVNEWTSSNTLGEIVVECDAEPYKYELNTSDSNWLWNPFSFIDGIAQTTKYTIDGTKNASIYSKSDIIPTFVSSGNIQIVFNGKTYSMGMGEKKFYDLQFNVGKNEITFIGNANVSVVFREKRL